MHIQTGENPAAVWIVLQVVKHPVHLVHHPFLIRMFHTQLIAVCLSNGTRLICPAVPDMAVQFMDIIGLLLPDPQKLIKSTANPCSAKGHCRKLPAQVIPVHHPKLLNRIGRFPGIFPDGTHFLTPGVHSIVQNLLAHVYKNMIGNTHPHPSFHFSFFITYFIIIQCPGMCNCIFFRFMLS